MKIEKYWGIITARSGSTRLINKNKLILINKPLIEYTYTSCVNSKLNKSTFKNNCIKIRINFSNNFF